MIRALRHLAGLVVVCGAAASVVVAQNPPPAQSPPPRTLEPLPQVPTFRSRIDTVSVDVTVTDKQGRPVTDLKEEDFEIRESNKPQAIDSFKIIKLDEPAAGAPTQSHVVRSISDMTSETGRDDTRVIVVFLDDYHVRRGNGLTARQNVSRFISQLGDHDLVAVMYPLMRLSDLTFTQDHDGTAAAILAFEGRKYDYSPKNAYEERLADQPVEVIERVRNDIVISALKGLCLHLGTLRSGRKSVLMVSEGLAGYIPPGVRTIGAMSPIGSVRTPTNLDDRVATLGNYDINSQMQDVYRAATRSNTALYTLDPRGLAPSEFGPQDNVTADADHRFLTETMDILRVMADQTDGRAIVGRNDPLPDLRQMIRDSSVYYLIGYTSTLAPRDGRFHAIQVKVKRKDVDVRAKKGYWAYTMDEIEKATAVTPAKAGPPPEVQEALEGLEAVNRGRAVRVWMGAERGAGAKAKVTLVWEATPEQPGNNPVDHLNVTISSVFGDMLFKGLVPRDPQAVKPSGRVSFDAPAGQVNVQVLAEDAKGQRVDHAEDAIDVPDFSGAAPFVSMPFVYRARTAREVQQLRGATETPAPTVAREFSRTERLLLRFQAAGPNGTVPTLTAKLLNPLGQSMLSLPAPTATPSGGFDLELSLGGLAPGDYLIEISGATEPTKPATTPDPAIATEPVRTPQTNAAANKVLIAFRVTG